MKTGLFHIKLLQKGPTKKDIDLNQYHYLIINVVLPICLHLDNRPFYIPYKKDTKIEIITQNIFNKIGTNLGTGKNIEIISDEFSHFRFTRLSMKIPLIDENNFAVDYLLEKYKGIFFMSLNVFIDSARIALKRYGLKNFHEFQGFMEPVDAKTSATELGMVYLDLCQGPLTVAKPLRANNEHIKIQELIQNNIPLYEAFLSDAKRELYYYNYIHSIINAVISFEIILSSFIRKEASRKGIDDNSTNEYIHNVGLTGNIKTTLKLLVPENTILPHEDIFQKCKSSITIRNAIMHRGRRDINPKDAKEFIKAIETMIRFCEKLIS